LRTSPVTTLEQRVLKSIRDAGVLKPGDRVGVAVSGGADSVALLRLLETLRERLGITLAVVHFDHALRGAESDGDARFAVELARAHGLECILERAEVAAIAAKRKWNLEDAARRLRYAFFDRVVGEGRATHVAVAHTIDDQAETVLAHLLRGTGPAGLAGIYPVAGCVFRPLLEFRRQELRKYLRNLGQAWREDTTNLDVSRMRARIRAQLVPLLERDFAPLVAPRLARLARISREEESFWAALVEDRIRALVKAGEGTRTIRIRDLLAPLDLPPYGVSDTTAPQRALTERIIRRLYRDMRGEAAAPTAERVEQVIRLARESASGKAISLPGGVRVEKSFDALIFSSTRPTAAQETASKQGAYQYAVKLPGSGVASISVPELQRRFSLKVIDWSSRERDTKRGAVALDAELLQQPLVLRNWRPGDAYRPKGRQRTWKLKRLFLAGRIPSRERASWPVLESAGRVVWARGMPPADECCAGERTRRGVVIEEERL